MWRLVLEGHSLEEIQRSWSLDQVLDCLEAMDWRADVDAAYTHALRQQAERNARRASR